MSSQGELFSRTRRDQLEAAFDRYCVENPRFWPLFERYAYELIAAGRSRYSARTILHRIRWHVAVELRDEDGFKVNNNLSPFAARRFMADHPEHEGLFELRVQHSELRLVT